MKKYFNTKKDRLLREIWKEKTLKTSVYKKQKTTNSRHYWLKTMLCILALDKVVYTE